MIIGLATVSVFIGCVVAVFLVGSRLSVSHVARMRAVLDRPVAEVWLVLGDFASYPQWRRGLARVEIDGARITEIDRRGGKSTYETVESVAEERMVRRMADEGRPFGGTWTLELQPLDGAHTTLTVTERGEVYSPIFRFVSKYFLGHHATMVSFLEDLARKLGTAVTIQKE